MTEFERRLEARRADAPGGTSDEHIRLVHGGGGRAMRELIVSLFAADPDPIEGGVGLSALDDGAAVRVGSRWLVITTDSHVIDPIFFPGGDIGRLAIAGTVNDLAMMGCTEPAALTAAVIVEEGFPIADLERVQRSLTATSREAGGPIVAGDTKVMGRGELDGLVLTTTAVGFTDRIVTDAGLEPGDALIITGTIGDHGLAVMAERMGIEVDGALRSDVAPLCGLVAQALTAGGDRLVAMKDPTRGGVASTLSEIAAKSVVGVVLDEAALPFSDGVLTVSELLGLDPLHVANGGKAILGVRPDAAPAVLEAVRRHPLGGHAAIIGRATADHLGSVVLHTRRGERLLSELESPLMPRLS